MGNFRAPYSASATSFQYTIGLIATSAVFLSNFLQFRFSAFLAIVSKAELQRNFDRSSSLSTCSIGTRAMQGETTRFPLAAHALMDSTPLDPLAKILAKIIRPTKQHVCTLVNQERWQTPHCPILVSLHAAHQRATVLLITCNSKR